MKAAVLKALGSPLAIETLPDPVLGTGEVIVDVVATRVISYANEVFSGARGYRMELPAVPGPSCIGRVRAVGPDATRLAVGEWVYCDPTVRARDGGRAPDILLQGWTAASAGGERLQRHFRHGSWAEQMRLPTENVTPIGAIDAREALSWCAMGSFLVPYGGFLAAGLEAGETVLVNGATGNFGAAGVAVALALGAGAVIATGRNATSLAELERRFGARVRTVQIRGDEAEDRKRMQQAAQGAIDCVLDILPPAADPHWVRAAAMCVRPYGRVVLMGGVGMAGGAGLELPYPWIMRNCITIHGQFMYPRDAPGRMAALIRAGLLRLDLDEVTVFDLDQANEAVAHAASHAGPFSKTILRP
jgi:NADPH:quinone reductase-like Zn-dependent oxidoreductase